MASLRSWYLAGRRTFILRLAGVGAAAGLASWLLALASAPLFGAVRPGPRELFLALALGTVVGGVLGLALAVFWDREARRRAGGS